jgi:YafQ family addiction module toxin component
MHYKAAWACGQAALRLAHMPTRRYDHHRLSPLVSTRNDEGPALATDQSLAERYHDHSLTGDWKDHRDCHVKPDLVLIYRKPDEESLQLVRLGSHSELGL